MPEIDDEASFALSLLRQGSWSELSGARIELLKIGMSDATVFRVEQDGAPDRYLKIARNEAAAALRTELARMKWLAARGMRVPVLLRVDDSAQQIIMLTEALPGGPANADALASPRVIEALAKGMAALHALPSGDCPFDESVAMRLSRAAAAVAAGEVDPEAFAPRNRNTPPATLLARLAAEPPAEDLVVVHGDATLSNIVVDANGMIGFVDCGNVGRGDRYLDLAVLHADIEDHYGGVAAARFAQSYGPGRWDSRKTDYFLDLYELF